MAFPTGDLPSSKSVSAPTRPIVGRRTPDVSRFNHVHTTIAWAFFTHGAFGRCKTRPVQGHRLHERQGATRDIRWTAPAATPISAHAPERGSLLRSLEAAGPLGSLHNRTPGCTSRRNGQDASEQLLQAVSSAHCSQRLDYPNQRPHARGQHPQVELHKADSRLWTARPSQCCELRHRPVHGDHLADAAII